MKKSEYTILLICFVLLCVGIILAIRENNSNMDEIKTSLSAKEQKLDRLEAQTDEIEARLVRLEQRLSPSTQ